MATKIQIEQIAAPFQARHPDFMWFQTYRLFQVPFTGHIKGFCFERSSDKNVIYIRYFALPLYFRPSTTIDMSFGRRLLAGSAGVWDAWRVDREETTRLAPIVMEETWNRLEKISSHADFFEYISDDQLVEIGSSITNPFVRGPMCAALAKRDEAVSAMQEAVAFDTKRRSHGAASAPFVRGAEDRALLLKTLQENPAGVYDLLHQWEAETVKNLGLEEHWRPMRFPGESTPPEPQLRP